MCSLSYTQWSSDEGKRRRITEHTSSLRRRGMGGELGEDGRRDGIKCG